MSGFGKVISLNDEAIESPKIRRDQWRKCQNIIRANSQFPIVALGLVRDYAKRFQFVKSILLDSEENPTEVQMVLKSDQSKMSMMYTWKLQAPTLLETPTLD